jgi:hypothetical protein
LGDLPVFRGRSVPSFADWATEYCLLSNNFFYLIVGKGAKTPFVETYGGVGVEG